MFSSVATQIVSGDLLCFASEDIFNTKQREEIFILGNINNKH